jgi:hypothetical protein
VIRTALMGYLHESMQNCGTALEHYARGGCLIEQRRLMFCLVQQFLGTSEWRLCCFSAFFSTFCTYYGSAMHGVRDTPSRFFAHV